MAPPLKPLPEPAAPDLAIDIRAVSRTYRDRRNDREVVALTDFSLQVANGEIVAVIGPNGCGKTTLLELVCRAQVPDRGSCACEPAALMPQSDALLPWLSALDNAALALRVHGTSRQEARQQAHGWFVRFGLEGFEAASVQAMSGGMRQRLSFLRTLLAGKPVLCLDEPFGALDALSRVQAQAWLAEALANPELSSHTVLLVTHDVEEALLLADRVIVLSPRPGHVVLTLPVDRPHPRTRTDSALIELRRQALAALGVKS